MTLRHTMLARSLMLGLGVSSCTLAAAQADQNCTQISAPADSGFDFTEGISRWGSLESFDVDSSQYQVRSIKINQLPIFDPKNPREDTRLFRWINRVHIPTRQQVIRHQLLFKEGDTVDSRMLSENERLLRQQKYASDAKVRVLNRCDQAVDLEVVTREVWTLVPGFSFHTSGGDNSLDVGLRDSNALGSGQRVSLFYSNDANRSSYKLAFENPNIGNTHRVIKLQADKSTDGFHYLAEYELPFFSLDADKAWKFGYESTKEMLSQYQFGKRVTEVDRRHDVAELSRGLSTGLVNGVTTRLRYGVRDEDYRYAPGTKRPAPAAMPDDLHLTYPFLELESIEDKYAVAYNISQIYRTEDLLLGRSYRASIGFATNSGGRLILNGQYSDTLLSRPKMLLQWRADWRARWDPSAKEWEDTLINANLDFHRGQTENRTLYMGLAASKAINLNSSEQLTLGGSTGLRGFDSHYLNGDTMLKFTAEERMFSNYQVLQLLRIGVAGFVDVGRVYGKTQWGAGRTFSNVGLGLRLAPSKTDEARIIHIDLAYPLGNNIPGGKSVQLVVEARGSF